MPHIAYTHCAFVVVRIFSVEGRAGASSEDRFPCLVRVVLLVSDEKSFNASFLSIAATWGA